MRKIFKEKPIIRMMAEFAAAAIPVILIPVITILILNRDRSPYPAIYKADTSIQAAPVNLNDLIVEPGGKSSMLLRLVGPQECGMVVRYSIEKRPQDHLMTFKPLSVFCLEGEKSRIVKVDKNISPLSLSTDQKDLLAHMEFNVSRSFIIE